MRITILLPLLGLLAASACQRTEQVSSNPLVSAPRTPDAPLRETHWELRRLAGQPLADSSATGRPFLHITDAGTAEGQASCNNFRSTLLPVANDGELQFSPLLSTRMACPALSTELLFTKALQSTRAYRISGDTLWLYGNPTRTGTTLARLEAPPQRRPAGGL